MAAPPSRAASHPNDRRGRVHPCKYPIRKRISGENSPVRAIGHQRQSSWAIMAGGTAESRPGPLHQSCRKTPGRAAGTSSADERSNSEMNNQRAGLCVGRARPVHGAIRQERGAAAATAARNMAQPPRCRNPRAHDRRRLQCSYATEDASSYEHAPLQPLQPLCPLDELLQGSECNSLRAVYDFCLCGDPVCRSHPGPASQSPHDNGRTATPCRPICFLQAVIYLTR